MSRTVALRSIGCRTNQQELSTLTFRLLKAGFSISDEVDDADVVIVNTCCVTGLTESRTRRLIQALTRKAPQARFLVTGCMVQKDPLLLAPVAYWIVGNARKENIPEIIDNEPAGIYVAPLNADPLGLNADDFVRSALEASKLTRIPVKIQEGCNFRCSYCIVPSVRGPSRCAPLAGILAAFRAASQGGAKEIVVTGTHIGQYRHGECDGLVSLLGWILEIPGEFRVRLSSIDPRELTPELLEMIGTNPRICAHAHVSVQSLDPDILTAMNRPSIDFERMVGDLAGFRTRFPNAALGGDFIAGFPGESEAQHRRTLLTIAMVGFTHGHVFRYSPRPGTPAAAMGSQNAEEVKKTRAADLQNALESQNDRFMLAQIGTLTRIIVEETSPVRGTTPNYLRISVPDSNAPRNSLLDVVPCKVIQGTRRYCLATVTGEQYV